MPFVGALPGKLGWEEGMSVVELDMEICEFTVFLQPSVSVLQRLS